MTCRSRLLANSRNVVVAASPCLQSSLLSQFVGHGSNQLNLPGGLYCHQVSPGSSQLGFGKHGPTAQIQGTRLGADQSRAMLNVETL